jgi:predicted small secreted protein
MTKTTLKMVLVLGLLAVLIVSVAGCTSSTNSAQGTTDYSSYFNKFYTGGNAIVTQPFTKSTNDRGDDVYKGVARNSSEPESAQYTIVAELTNSQDAAKSLYNQTVAQKINEGFTSLPDYAAAFKAEFPSITEVWFGQSQQTGQGFYVIYYNDANVSPSWVFTTEAGGAG